MTNTNTYLMTEEELDVVHLLEVLKTFQIYGKCTTIEDAIAALDIPHMEKLVEQKLALEEEKLRGAEHSLFGQPYNENAVQETLASIFGEAYAGFETSEVDEEENEDDEDFDSEFDDAFYDDFDYDEEDDEEDFGDSAESWPNTRQATSASSPVVPSAPWPNVGQTSVAVAPVPISRESLVSAIDSALKAKASPVRTTVARDNRQRACVPTSMAQTVGFKANSPVFVSRRNGGTGLVLLKKASQTGHLSTYLVDSYGNIRLSQYILRTGGLANGPVKFRIADDGHGILVLQG